MFLDDYLRDVKDGPGMTPPTPEYKSRLSDVIEQLDAATAAAVR